MAEPIQITGAARQGSVGTVIRSGQILDVDESAEFKGSNWTGTPTRIGTCQRMARDSRVRRADQSQTMPIRRAIWAMNPGAEEPRAVEAAAYAHWNFFARLDWDTFVRQSCSDAQFGSAVFEATDDVVDLPVGKFPLHPGGGRGIAFTGLHHIPRWSIKEWDPDPLDRTKLRSVVQWPEIHNGASGVPARIDGNRIIRFSFDQDGGNFDGFPLWRSAAAAWKIKITLRVLDAIRHERQGLGVPTIELPPEAKDEDIAKAEEILAEMRAHDKGFIILPNGFKFSWTAGGTSTNMAEAIAYCDREIEFVFGASFLSLGSSGAGPGSYALSSTLDGQHELIIETRALERANKLYRGSEGWSPIERLIRLNYGPDVALPIPVVRNLPTRDWSGAMPVVRDLIAQKAIIVDKPLRVFIREVLTLPQEDPTTAEPNRDPSPPPAGAPPPPPPPAPPEEAKP